MAKAIEVKIHFNQLPDIRKLLPKEVDELVEVIAHEGRNIVVRSMAQSPATGETYTRSGGVTHTASAPGNPPRIDTGELVNSITPNKRSEALWAVDAGTEYAHYLEYGSTRIAARPYMGPMSVVLQKGISTIANGWYTYKGFLK